jgi:hypothetical protein
MKQKTVFFLLLGVWIFDFLTTFYALNFMSGIYEFNPIARNLFRLGWYGYLLQFVLAIFVFLCLSWIVMILYKNLQVKRHFPERKAFWFSVAPVIAIFWFEAYAITNNFLIIIGLN